MTGTDEKIRRLAARLVDERSRRVVLVAWWGRSGAGPGRT